MLHNHSTCIGSEYQSWLLYYSIPVLIDILPDVYLNHYALLVTSIHFLLGSSISDSELYQAESFLIQFYQEFEHGYGTE